MRRILLPVCALLGAAFASGVHAAGGTGSYELPWRTRGEVLEYRSCGCADSCWVAEVRDTRTKALKGRLRCAPSHHRLQRGIPKPRKRTGFDVELVEAIGKTLERLLLRAR